MPGSAILERPTDVKRPGRNVPQPSTPPASAAAPGAKPAGSGDPELDARRKKADDEKTAQQKVQEQKVAQERSENDQHHLQFGFFFGHRIISFDSWVPRDDARAACLSIRVSSI